jgi:hypothetical protein
MSGSDAATPSPSTQNQDQRRAVRVWLRLTNQRCPLPASQIRYGTHQAEYDRPIRPRRQLPGAQRLLQPARLAADLDEVAPQTRVTPGEMVLDGALDPLSPRWKPVLLIESLAGEKLVDLANHRPDVAEGVQARAGEFVAVRGSNPHNARR